MIADFVNKRGGGLLMLGGRRSFAEGGWGGTPVGEVLPVVLENANAKYFSELFQAQSDAGGRDLPGHADRRRREGLGREMESTCRR